MKYITVLILGLLFSCNGRNDNDAAIQQVDGAGKLPDSVSVQNSQHYLGRYEGKLPCQGCSGINASLELTEGFNYLLTEKKIGSTEAAVETKGKFAWRGPMIELDRTGPNRFMVQNGKLSLVEVVGNRIATSQFELLKVGEAQAAKTDSQNPGKRISGIHWTLTELNGKAMRKSGRKDFFVETAAGNTFGAFAGCNSIGGKYTEKGNSIRFSDVAATEMACDEMQYEAEFLQMLTNADNFIRNDKNLMLRRSNTIIAKFEAMPEKLKP